MKFLRLLVFFVLPFVCLSIALTSKKRDDSTFGTSKETLYRQPRHWLFDWVEKTFKSEPLSGQAKMFKPCVWKICSRPLRKRPETSTKKQERKKLSEKEFTNRYFEQKFWNI